MPDAVKSAAVTLGIVGLAIGSVLCAHVWAVVSIGLVGLAILATVYVVWACVHAIMFD